MTTTPCFQYVCIPTYVFVALGEGVQIEVAAVSLRLSDLGLVLTVPREGGGLRTLKGKHGHRLQYTAISVSRDIQFKKKKLWKVASWLALNVRARYGVSFVSSKSEQRFSFSSFRIVFNIVIYSVRRESRVKLIKYAPFLVFIYLVTLSDICGVMRSVPLQCCTTGAGHP